NRLFDSPGLLEHLPEIWHQNLDQPLHAIARQHNRMVVVMDDTLTGSQAMHNTPVLTNRQVSGFAATFESTAHSMVILMNTRNLSRTDATALYRRVTHNLLEAQQRTGREFVIVSRGESTLLGHFPLDVEAVGQAMPTRYDGVLFVPGINGSYTVDNIHYIEQDDDYLPAAETNHARDYAFGYNNSDMRTWIAEKTGGRIAAASVQAISLDTIRRGGPQAVRDRLLTLQNGAFCVANTAHRRDIDVVALGAHLAEQENRRFYYRASSDFAAAYSGIAPQPPVQPDDLPTGDSVGGLVVIGSHARRSTEQLIALLASSEVTGIEVRVESLLHDESQRAEVARCSDILESALQQGDVVLYTSRRIIGADDPAHATIVTQRVNTGLVSIINGVTAHPRYVIVKGSITAADVVTRSLNVKRAIALGEVAPDAVAWQIGNSSTGQQKRSVVIIPGNTGEQDMLLHLVRQLR
ncbi:MAG: four-carbon acid sugar kinase family protein, partial [Chloroflexota bacterium]